MVDSQDIKRKLREYVSVAINRSWTGNVSGSKAWVSDGKILARASNLRPHKLKLMTDRQDPDGRKATVKDIQTLWNSVTGADHHPLSLKEVKECAEIGQKKNRFRVKFSHGKKEIYLDAQRLLLMLDALKVDVALHGTNPDSPVVAKHKDRPVAIIMPLSVPE